MSAMSQRDLEVNASVIRNHIDVSNECARLAAEAKAAGDQASAGDLFLAARRYRELAAAAPNVWANADRLAALTANATHDSAWDAETEACAARDTEEIPRVH